MPEMSYGKLAEIVVRFIELLELADDLHIDPDSAVSQLENIAADLTQASHDEREVVMNAARSRLASFQCGPDEFAYRPRISEEHRALLENIASGAVFGWSSSDPT